MPAQLLLMCEHLRVREGCCRHRIVTHTLSLGTSKVWAALLSQPACIAQQILGLLSIPTPLLSEKEITYSLPLPYPPKGRKCKSSSVINKVKLGPGRTGNEA